MVIIDLNKTIVDSVVAETSMRSSFKISIHKISKMSKNIRREFMADTIFIEDRSYQPQ
jgi:hypothetical protein